MLIPGHVGFTLGLATVVQKVRHQPPVNFQQLSIFAFAALLPDILDKSLHWLCPTYSEHQVFHSFVFYASALLVLWWMDSRLLLYVGIMALHPLLDFANNDPRDLLWPASSWMGWTGGRPLIEPYMHRLPPYLSMTVLWGHYLAFELAGLVLILWAIWNTAKNRAVHSPFTTVAPDYLRF